MFPADLTLERKLTLQHNPVTASLDITLRRIKVLITQNGCEAAGIRGYALGGDLHATISRYDSGEKCVFTVHVFGLVFILSFVLNQLSVWKDDVDLLSFIK